MYRAYINSCYVIRLIIGVSLAIIMLSFNVCRWAYNEVSFRMQLRHTEHRK